MHINFGQRPFVQRPAALTDANNLQTQNLPAATIPNGRDHFQAITDTGANILTAAQDAFDTGLWWIKDTANSNQHQLVDSINGATSCRQLNAGTTGAYVAPAGDSVAWCWDWNQADPQANGFNIVDFDVSGDPVTIDTGLDNPEWIVFYSSSANTFSGFRVLENGFLELRTNQRFLAGSSIQWQTGANAGEVILDGAIISGVGKLFAWQSVPGYSAFGSYQGNSDTNGPFIYTGFRPAFILTKRATADEDWSIVDTTRSIDNPAFQNLRPNQTNGEGGGIGSNDIDILSNGFKLRNNTDRFNSTGTYVYACFAENPFGASNTAPANAR
jgi:hypothetical protein